MIKALAGRYKISSAPHGMRSLFNAKFGLFSRHYRTCSDNPEQRFSSNPTFAPSRKVTAIAVTLALALTAQAPAVSAQQATIGVYNTGNAAEAEALARKARIQAQKAADLERKAMSDAEATRRDELRITEIEKEIAELEAMVSQSRARLVALANEEAGSTEAMRLRRRQNAAAFSAMIALSKSHAPELVAYSGDPLTAARGASVLTGLREALAINGRVANDRMRAINDLRLKTEAAREETREAIASLRSRERELWVLVGKRKQQSRETLEQAEALKLEAESMTDRARTLSRLLRRSPAPPAKPVRQAAVTPTKRILPPPQPLNFAKGNFAWPVTGGEIAQQFGQAATGNEALGMVFDAKPYALVYAPWNGTLGYAGPVNSFGLVAVIDIGEDYQIVLAGLSDLIRKKGDPVQRGEPIGTLTGPISESEEFLADEAALSANAVASLYLQMRLRGKPIDPGEWFGPSGGQIIRKVDAQ